MADPYLTVDELLADPALDRLSAMDPTTLADYVTQFEDTAEAYLDVAFRPREAAHTWTVLGRATNTVLLPHARVRSVDDIEVDGQDLAAGAYALDGYAGRIRFRHGYRLDLGQSCTITYTHGIDAPPPVLTQACKRFVANEAAADLSGTSRNIIGQSVDGSYIRYSTPDWAAGRPTGWLNVDQALNTLRGKSPVLVA